MKLTYFLTSAIVSAVSVVGQTACSTTGAFTSYTDLVLKAFYTGNPTPVPIYVKNVLTVPHTGYDILSVRFSRQKDLSTCRTERKELTGWNILIGMHEYGVLYLQDLHDFGQRKAQTMGPGKRVLANGFFACD